METAILRGALAYRGQVTGEQRTLILLRHAKSDYPPDTTDHQRPLAARGTREAELAGDWLRANLPPIDLVLCSTASRTRQTLTRTHVQAPVNFLDRLYDAAPGTVIREINQTGDDVTTLLVVGHEPAMSTVALGLAGAAGTDSAVAECISAKFPTSGIAVLSVDCGWADLAPGGAALVDFHVPR